MNQEDYPSPYHNQTDPLANVPVTPLMIEHLRATKPWVRFMSIIMFILAGLIVLGGLGMMFMSSSYGDERFRFWSDSWNYLHFNGRIISRSGIFLAPIRFIHQ